MIHIMIAHAKAGLVGVAIGVAGAAMGLPLWLVLGLLILVGSVSEYAARINAEQAAQNQQKQ